MSEKSYVVKVRRTYCGRDVTSVLSTPVTKKKAEEILHRYTVPLQSNQFYIEEWRES